MENYMTNPDDQNETPVDPEEVVEVILPDEEEEDEVEEEEEEEEEEEDIFDDEDDDEDEDEVEVEDDETIIGIEPVEDEPA
jgi:hypothetical protein